MLREADGISSWTLDRASNFSIVSTPQTESSKTRTMHGKRWIAWTAIEFSFARVCLLIHWWNPGQIAESPSGFRIRSDLGSRICHSRRQSPDLPMHDRIRRDSSGTTSAPNGQRPDPSAADAAAAPIEVGLTVEPDISALGSEGGVAAGLSQTASGRRAGPCRYRPGQPSSDQPPFSPRFLQSRA